MLSSKQDIYNSTILLRMHRTFWKRGRKECKSQKTGKRAARYCLVMVPLLQSQTLEKLWLPTLGLHKDRPLTIKDG